MKTMQQKSVDYLRDKCYVVVYSQKREFLNHAKFLMYYHACFSEKIIYHGKYFGSTNLTLSGLWKPRQSQGNYEEFTFNRGIKLGLSRADEFYLNEVFDLISHKASLYTDPQYLTKFMLDHITSLENLLHDGREIISQGSSSKFEKLYEIYINSLLAYAQIFALLDEVPGKKLTGDIIRKLISTKPPLSPFEIEMMLIDPEYVNLIIEDLELDKGALYELIKENIGIIENAFNLISRYQTLSKEIKNYMDDKEINFVKFLDEYNKAHIESIKALIKRHERDTFHLFDSK
jgi:hypothetical protein